MSDTPDFEFDLGKGRRLKGRGWRGLVALALLLATIPLLVLVANPGISTLFMPSGHFIRCKPMSSSWNCDGLRGKLPF